MQSHKHEAGGQAPTRNDAGQDALENSVKRAEQSLMRVPRIARIGQAGQSAITFLLAYIGNLDAGVLMPTLLAALDGQGLRVSGGPVP